MEPFYRLAFADGSTLDCNGDSATMAKRFGALSPGDEAGYHRFMAASEAIFRVGFEELSAVPFSRLTDMLKVLPGMVRLRADRSLYKLAARHVRDERLRIALSFHPLFIGGNPFDVTSIYGLITHLEKAYGVHSVIGGTAALVQGLVNLLHRQGATFRMQTPVAAIAVESGRATGVRLATGEGSRQISWSRMPASAIPMTSCWLACPASGGLPANWRAPGSPWRLCLVFRHQPPV